MAVCQLQQGPSPCPCPCPGQRCWEGGRTPATPQRLCGHGAVGRASGSTCILTGQHGPPHGTPAPRRPARWVAATPVPGSLEKQVAATQRFWLAHLVGVDVSMRAGGAAEAKWAGEEGGWGHSGLGLELAWLGLSLPGRGRQDKGPLCCGWGLLPAWRPATDCHTLWPNFGPRPG